MRRLAAPLLALSLLIPLATACGESASAQEVVAGAAEATIEASTARTAMHMVMEGLPGAGTLEFDLDGVIDFDAQRTEMTIDMGEAMGELGVEGVMKMRTIGMVIYMQSELFSQGLPGIGPDTWLKLDINEAAKEGGVDLGQLSQLGGGSNDPRQGLAMLQGVTDDGVQELGENDVRGTETTHYRARIDVRKAMEESGAIIDREAFEQFAKALGQDTIRVDVWIDGDNQLRKMTMPLPLPPEAGGAEATMTIEYYDFGIEVDVAEPPAEDVIDFREVLGQAQPQS